MSNAVAVTGNCSRRLLESSHLSPLCVVVFGYSLGTSASNSRALLIIMGAFARTSQSARRALGASSRDVGPRAWVVDKRADQHPAGEAALPLCVDLDGTLVRSDTLAEGLAALATRWRLARLLISGAVLHRARFKQRIAEEAAINPALLPYNETLLAWLRQQKAEGRILVLVSAANVTTAEAVAKYLGLFDAVFASDGTHNLKGRAKARALIARFGERRFVYVGDSRADLSVWRVAGGGVIVNASRYVAAAARQVVAIETEINERFSVSAALLRAMRPYQWMKNILVFVPILTAHAVVERTAWIGALAMFAAFCATASAIYLFNDLTDLAADRAHPRKRHRPLASGAISLQLGAMLVPLLLACGMALAIAAHALPALLLYAVLSIAYSVKLKEEPLVDVFLLAWLYTIRLLGGGEAAGHRLSLWLLGFSSFLFLSLALAKRTGEMMGVAHDGEPAASRRSYRAGDILILQTFGCGAAFASAVVLALFVQSEATAQLYASPGLLWGTVPLMLFWQCRIWLATSRGYMLDDPIVYALHDWITWLVAALMFALLALAKSIAIPLP
jgi:4-hydroxybenzoate polyprenyltransferase/phosphoserine phosphatase